MLQGVLQGCLAVAAMATLQADELELKPETLKIWNEYEQAANVAMQQRLHGDGPFLRVDGNAERLARMRAGDIVVWPACPNDPKRITSGLIHDWIGAAFIPNSRIVDVIAVARDYARYKNVYNPGVLDARLISQKPDEDHFSLLLKNPTFFTKTALEGDFQSSYIRLDDTRWYSMTRAMSFQEIEDFGQATQHKLAPDRGHGYIWRMTSLAQMEERDGGVYVEEEVIALSRDVPSALRWMAGPIVRRVARDSTALSIERTRAAVVSRPEVISSRLSALRKSTDSAP
jgi:hypothetical protein